MCEELKSRADRSEYSTAKRPITEFENDDILGDKTQFFDLIKSGFDQQNIIFCL